MVPGADAIETLRADVNTRKGETRIFASLTVVEDGTQTDKFNQVQLAVALRKNPAAQAGDVMEFNVTPKDFGRIAVQTAKQTMMQRLRQAEKEMIYEEFKDRAGDIVSGTVRRFERNDVMIDLGKFEGILPNRERVQGEDYNIGDRIRAYVLAVENEGRGPEIILSRSHPNFVRRLFEAEVNEISDHTVEIRGVAREAGFRTKIAVWSKDPKVDAVGACVGMRGARVKNIVRELNNEKVDIIRWSEDPKEFVREALKPADLKTITIDEESHVVHVTVTDEDLSKAIGRKGQNARLSSRLMGWDIQVRRDESKEEQFKEKIGGVAHTLCEQLGISEEEANKLTLAGGFTPDLVVEMPADFIAELLGIPEATAEAILSRANAFLGNEPAALSEES
jgi:N utilization substance protein A